MVTRDRAVTVGSGTKSRYALARKQRNNEPKEECGASSPLTRVFRLTLTHQRGEV